MQAEIFLWQSKMAWEGVNFFFKIKSVSISLDALLHFVNTKMFFDACRLSLHNSTPSHCTTRRIFVAVYVSHLLPLSFCIHLKSSVTLLCSTCSPVVCIALFFTVARPGQLSTTHFRYFTPFFVIYSHTIVHCVHIYTPYYTGTCLHSPFRLRIVLHYSCCRLYTCRPCA